ncbi:MULTISPECIES: type II secretion system F family protein [unclassified Aureimonas]|uniref:type II secretion system F family protein n=1 Tax=unclassified Aureimonas TaxID=2615206 RepID=UPI0006F38071|nr:MULTISPECIES: type II secretion system F family protein [unclassified Aureimonas]KQT53862.1 pilus assembly protein [Aureimonas sp. Leaf427]KQT71697.1 pilus assembly protein [Aureimonas sp. Leaf460]
MSGLPLILFVVLSTLSCGALAYVLLQPRIASERNAEARLNQFKRAETDGSSKRIARDRLQEAAKRRKTIQTSLKEIEEKQKERSRHTAKPSLKRRMEQAGLTISDRQFVLGSSALGLVALLVALMVGQPLWIAGSIGLMFGYAMPRMTVNHLRKKRQAKFIDELPNAIDLIVRGVKSGLPVNDTIRMISTEAAEPVKSEFRKVVEAQQVGLSMSEAVERLYENMPIPEVNFFSIVVSIQSQAGGNLSEALGNLSRVLRDRKRMKGKIQAMSMEAKASGGIIGALPIVVGTLVYITTPDYIGLLFTQPVGNLLLGASAIWMVIGIVVMRQMINFDF